MNDIQSNLIFSYIAGSSETFSGLEIGKLFRGFGMWMLFSERRLIRFY